jgi:hypothetical protein
MPVYVESEKLVDFPLCPDDEVKTGKRLKGTMLGPVVEILAFINITGVYAWTPVAHIIIADWPGNLGELSNARVQLCAPKPYHVRLCVYP